MSSNPMKLETFGGGDGLNATTIIDTQNVSFTTRVNVSMKSEDREVDAAVPVYEIPLLKRRYRQTGGSLTISNDWLYSRETGVEAYPRVVPLSRYTLRKEFERLASTYVIASQNGGKMSFYEQVYGKGAQKFYDKVTECARYWVRLVAKMKSEGRHKPTLEEIEALAAICEPEDGNVEEVKISEIELPDNAVQPEAVVDINDPTIALSSFLAEKDISPEIISAVCDLYAGNDKVTPSQITQIEAVRGKPKLAAEIVDAIRAFEKRKPVEPA